MEQEYTNLVPDGSTVTINATTVARDGNTTAARSCRFAFGASPDNQTFVLDFWPVDATGTLVAYNSQVQQYGVNYTLVGNVLTLTTPLSNPNDYLYVMGLAYVEGETTTNPSVVPVGSKMIWLSLAGAATNPLPPPGWLPMDSLVTTYNIADYPIFWAWLATLSSDARAQHLSAETATTFTLAIIDVEGLFTGQGVLDFGVIIRIC